MKYYTERNNKLNESFGISFDDLKYYFNQTYRYFDNKGYFKVAYEGVYIMVRYANEDRQVLPPTMAPSPEIFFINHLRKDSIYPISQHFENYSEEELFTVIEILFDHIGIYDYTDEILIKEYCRDEFAESINNMLRFYKGGYMLDKANGFIMEVQNQSLQSLLQTEIPEGLADGIIEKIRTATKMFYRFDTNEELKKKAINILADVLEFERENLKTILNKEYEINKNNHDKLIFDIVNNFNIRHNNTKQLSNYNKAIWYDWMMQYYTSVILTYYRLISEQDKKAELI